MRGGREVEMEKFDRGKTDVVVAPKFDWEGRRLHGKEDIWF